MDLISLVITLRPLPQAENPEPLPTWWGRAAHALLLKTVRTEDENLAAALHDEDGIRPFTASSLLGGVRRGRLDPDARATLRFTGLDARVSAILVKASLPGGCLAPGQAVELDYFPYEVLSATCDPAQHEWAGTADYAVLAAACLAGSDPAARRIALRFASPTQFHSQDRTVPLPLPDLVFGSLAERWNAFAPIAFPAEVKRYAAECLAVSRFELSSRAVAMKSGGKRIGAVGSATYAALTYDRYWMSLVQTLGAFALYAGVGAGTSMGLGQARQMNPVVSPE
jgi:CRISPR-associated endoribonuclease Cas6